ncbi:MAG TPA: hypothetical protein VNH14_09950 [Gemmatimonadales bacterium]|nr:hypothetical protein [Gemmatimonadales bacterium]
MPNNLPHFTTCASPGAAYKYTAGDAITTLMAVGLVAYIALAIVTVSLLNLCAAIAALCVGLIAALDNLNYWFYNERLMCIRPNRCAVGTVAGDPFDACDGDRKIDILIAPFGFREVEREMLEASATALSAANPGFPAPPPDFVNSRASRLSYVFSTLNDAQRRRLYLDVVHNQMFAPYPNRRFQAHYYVRDRVVMGDPAYLNSPPDDLASADPNPMFRYEREPGPPPPFIAEVFCEWLLGEPMEEPHEERLVPYMHCEVEGNRFARGIENLKLTIFAFGATWATVCYLCSAAVGGLSLACAAVAAVAALFVALITWLLSKVFNDPNDGEAGAISVGLPEVPDADARGSKDEVGDLVCVIGDWIMDVEHDVYFEMHPVKAWYRIAKDPRGDPRHDDDGTGPPHGHGHGQDGGHGHDLDVRDLTDKDVSEMCSVATSAEAGDPEITPKYGTTAALSMMAGFVR